MNNQQLVKKCQENIWLKRGGVMFEDEPFAEFDYEYSFHRCSSLEELKNKFLQGNWSIRQGFLYENLAFINQVNGGDEWWTLKEFDDKLFDFESITFNYIIRNNEFEGFIERLLKATKEQCKKLEY